MKIQLSWTCYRQNWTKIWPELQIFFFSIKLAHTTVTIRGFWNIYVTERKKKRNGVGFRGGDERNWMWLERYHSVQKTDSEYCKLIGWKANKIICWWIFDLLIIINWLILIKHETDHLISFHKYLCSIHDTRKCIIWHSHQLISKKSRVVIFIFIILGNFSQLSKNDEIFMAKHDTYVCACVFFSNH